MSSDPLVSIVIPVYNGSNFIAQAIESALAQTYPNVEVVVVNDGSADEGATERIALGFVPRIRYFEQPNGGVAAALNRGIHEARGDYVSWLSHDDLLLPDKLARQMALVRERVDARLVPFGDFDVEEVETGRRFGVQLPRVLRLARTSAILSVLFMGRLHGCTLLLSRRSLEEVGAFAEELRTTQDYDLWFRMFAAGYRFVHMRGSLIRTRWHAAQGTRTMSALHRREASELYLNAIRRLPTEIRTLGVLEIARIRRSLLERDLRDAADALMDAWTAGSAARRAVRVLLEFRPSRRSDVP